MRNVNGSTLISSLVLVLSLTALTIASGAHAQLLSFDFDGDGVPDEEDLCPLTTDLTGPIPTETLCEGCLSDAETVQGCNAEDVLACKPGPNYHDRKFGVPARVVDKFINKLAWAKKCSYDPPPPPPPPETSGTASDVEELVLSLPNATFAVPPAALPDGTPITFSYQSASVIEPGVLGPNETVVSLVYKLEFSVQQVAGEILRLQIEVPPGVDSGIYALAKVRSELVNDGPAIPEWTPLVGAYDSTEGLFTVELAATAEAFSIFVVTRSEGAQSASAMQTFKTRLASLRSWVTDLGRRAMGIFGPSTAAARPQEGELLSRGWVAACRPEGFTPEQQSRCQFGSPELAELAQTAHQMASILDGKGLPNARIEVKSPAEMVNAGFPTAYFNPGGIPSAEYNVVWMVGPDRGFRGMYDSQTARLFFAGGQPSVDFIVLHELFHAVTEVEMPSWTNERWIEEAYASATQVWAPSWAGTAQDWRFTTGEGIAVWRNWEAPLYLDRASCTEFVTFSCLAPYTAGELWLDADPQLNTLPPLWQHFPALPDQAPFTEHYSRFDEQWQLAGGPSLSDAFVAVIEKRSADENYPYCGALLDPNDIDGPRSPFDAVECTSTPCELSDTLDLGLQRMSAKCFRPIVTLPPSDVCPGEEIYSIEFGGDPDVNRYILDGTTYAPGDTIEDAPAAFKLWALDKGTDSPLAVSQGSVLIDSDCPPEPPPSTQVRLLTQRHFVRAEAALGGIFLSAPYCASPYRIAEAVTTYSSEDGLNESYRRTTHTEWDYFSCTGLNYLCPSTSDEVPIEPIGFGTVGEALSLSVESVGDLRPDQTACQNIYPIGTGQASSVSYSVNTQPSANGTGIVIEGLIESTLTATTPATPPCVDDCNGDGAATGLYDITFEVDGPTSATLNYSCSATGIFLRGAGGDLLSLRHWSQQRELEDWTCEPYSAELTPEGNPYRLQITGGSDANVDPDVQGRNQSVDFSFVIGGGDTGGVSVSSTASSP